MMSVTAAWDNNEHTVLRLDFGGGWDWQRFHSGLAEARQMLGGAPESVDVILHLGESDRLPRGVFAQLRHLDRLGQRARQVIVVGQGVMVRALFDALRRLRLPGRAPLLWAASLDEARALVRFAPLAFAAPSMAADPLVLCAVC